VLGEIRTYTAQQGNLDDLVRVLNGVVFPNHRLFDIPVTARARSRGQAADRRGPVASEGGEGGRDAAVVDRNTPRTTYSK